MDRLMVTCLEMIQNEDEQLQELVESWQGVFEAMSGKVSKDIVTLDCLPTIKNLMQIKQPIKTRQMATNMIIQLASVTTRPL